MVIGNCGILFPRHHCFVKLHGLVFVVGIGASSVGSYEGVPHERIGVRKVVKDTSGVVEISQRGVKKNSCIEKKSLWVVGVNCS